MSTKELRDVKKIKELNDMPYRLRYRYNYNNGEIVQDWQYVHVSNYGHDQELVGLFENFYQVIVEDAITGKQYQLEYGHPHYEVEEIPYGDWDDDIMNKYVEEEFQKALEVSKNAGEGLQVGKLFSVGVADGSAWYVVKRVNKKTVRVQWRGFSYDRYMDQVLGYEGSFPKESIEPMVLWQDKKGELFGSDNFR
jgi:hypothetical protein